MSVINKMLRDLDRRQTDQAAAQTVTQVPGQQSLRAGTQSLGADVRQGDGLARGGTARWWGAALLVLLSVGAYVLWWGSGPDRQPAPAGSIGVEVTTMAPPMTSASAPVFAAAPAVLATPSQAPSPALAAPVGPVVPRSSVSKPVSLVKKEQPHKSIGASETPAPPQAAPALAALPPQSQPQTTTSTQPPTAQTPLPGTSVKTQSQVAMEALAHAQTQWAEGDQAGALQVVQGVIARLEKSPTGDTLALATAAREYVRMTTAQQRPADALAMLVRLEAPLAQVADIWALRGNTAQRLGLHAQAVHAYLNALELQPGQARWLLAAAVSMAAQGQTVPAAELAEKARRAGFLPPDVANYLQQLGVTLRKP